MTDELRTLKPWVIFAGCCLIIVVLYWAQAVLVPMALATLLSFLLTPPVTWLQRWIGRVAAVLAVVAFAFTLLALAGWGPRRKSAVWRRISPSIRAISGKRSPTYRTWAEGVPLRKFRKRSKISKTRLPREQLRAVRLRSPLLFNPSRSQAS
jgi:hypothetical protein